MKMPIVSNLNVTVITESKRNKSRQGLLIHFAVTFAAHNTVNV